MRALVIALLIYSGTIWLSSSPVYYFVWGSSAAKLPQHVRMTDGETEAGCKSLVRDFDRTFPNSGVYCESVPRWKHWSNAVRNFAYQIDTYRLQKATALVE
jgi:hypothetical protein